MDEGDDAEEDNELGSTKLRTLGCGSVLPSGKDDDWIQEDIG